MLLSRQLPTHDSQVEAISRLRVKTDPRDQTPYTIRCRLAALGRPQSIKTSKESSARNPSLRL